MPIGRDFRNSLSGLLLALQSGLAPDIAASQFSNLIAERQAQQQARREQIGSLTEQLLGLAGSGMPLAAAETYLSSLGEAGIIRPRQMDRLEDVAIAAYDVPRQPTSAPPTGNVLTSAVPQVGQLVGQALASATPGGIPLSALASTQGGRLSPLAPPPAPPAMPGPVEELAEMADALRIFAVQGMSKDQALMALGANPLMLPTLRRLADEVYRDLGV